MRTKPKTPEVVATWPQRVKHVNSKTNDEKMFFALHFIQVGKGYMTLQSCYYNLIS